MIMKTTIAVSRDRGGQRARGAAPAVLGALAVLAVLLFPRNAAAQRRETYDAPRFDVAVQVLDGGDLDVRETITFRFQSGTFRRVWREIPTSRTDGVDVIDASMDGTSLARGEGPGAIKVSGRNRIKVEWQFEPVGPSIHTFGLHYRARGVVFRDGAHDVVRWRLLPTEHRYRIGESRSTIAAPASVSAAPAIESRRVGAVSHAQQGGSVGFAASNVERNGWIIAELRCPAGALIETLPEWQQRHDLATALASRWIAIAAGLFVASLVALFSIRQAYPRPSVPTEETTTTDPPEPLPAALAAVLAAKGATSPYVAPAAIFDLADRGVVTVRELPRTLGVRSYELSRAPGGFDLAEHEQEALDIVFAGRGERVTLSKARGRLARSARRFTAAVTRDLLARGYLDERRRAVHDRLTYASAALLVAAAIGSIAMATLIPRFEGWPFLLPFALCAAGILGIIMAVNAPPLSDQGLVQAARWRGFRRHLRSTVAGKDSGAATPLEPRWLVYGIAVGLAPHWARYFKSHPGAAPPWFEPAASNDGAAFAAFVGSHAASTSGGGGAGGAAAGGGSSGAG
jgi:hypothetical protein